MNAVEKEVEEHCPILIGKVVVDVEEEAMKGVFEDRPDDIAEKEAGQGACKGGGGGSGDIREGEGEELRGVHGATYGQLTPREGCDTYGSLNWSMERTKRKAVIGPQKMGTTNHFVRVND